MSVQSGLSPCYTRRRVELLRVGDVKATTLFDAVGSLIEAGSEVVIAGSTSYSGL
jgi:hypothetical protein